MRKFLFLLVFGSFFLHSNAQINRAMIGNEAHTNLDLLALEALLADLQAQIDQLQNIASVAGGTADLSALWAAVDANTARVTITPQQAAEIAANTLKVSGDDGEQGEQGVAGPQGPQGDQGRERRSRGRVQGEKGRTQEQSQRLS